MQHMKHVIAILETYDAFMQHCWMTMHDDAHDQVLVVS
jgi:hypothetical protein